VIMLQLQKGVVSELYSAQTVTAVAVSEEGNRGEEVPPSQRGEVCRHRSLNSSLFSICFSLFSLSLSFSLFLSFSQAVQAFHTLKEVLKR
jgi:hypothetical protein